MAIDWPLSMVAETVGTLVAIYGDKRLGKSTRQTWLNAMCSQITSLFAFCSVVAHRAVQKSWRVLFLPFRGYSRHQVLVQASS